MNPTQNTAGVMNKIKMLRSFGVVSNLTSELPILREEEDRSGGGGELNALSSIIEPSVRSLGESHLEDDDMIEEEEDTLQSQLFPNNVRTEGRRLKVIAVLG